MVDLGKSTWKYCLEILTRAIGNRFGPDDHIYLVRTYGRSTVSKIIISLRIQSRTIKATWFWLEKGAQFIPMPQSFTSIYDCNLIQIPTEWRVGISSFYTSDIFRNIFCPLVTEFTVLPQSYINCAIFDVSVWWDSIKKYPVNS